MPQSKIQSQSTGLSSSSANGTYARLDGANQPFTGNISLNLSTPVLTITNTSNNNFSTLNEFSLVLGNSPFSLTASSITADGAGSLILIGSSIGNLKLTSNSFFYDSAPSGSSGSNFTFQGDTAFGTSNLSGGNLSLAGGNGTGNGISRVVIQTMGGGASGSTSSTVITSNIFSTDGTIGILTGATAGGKIIGGTNTTADLYLQTTSGVGASGADMHFLVGNNGATEAMTVLNAGTILFPLLTSNGFVKTSGGTGTLSIDIASYTPTSRLINTTSPLAGGGDLSADRTLTIGNAAADGVTKGAATFNATNFTASSGVVNTIQDITTTSGVTFKTMQLVNDGGSASNTFTSYVSSATLGSNQTFRHARGSLASPSVLLDGDLIGVFTFTGYTGSFASVAQIKVNASGDYGVSNRGSIFTFNTVDAGSSSLVTKMTLDINGLVMSSGVPFSVDTMKNNAIPTTVNGSVGGTAIFSQPEQGSSYKIIMINLSSLNGTASYTFPVAFGQTPTPVSSSTLASLVSTVSTTAVTITGTVSTGNIMLIGS